MVRKTSRRSENMETNPFHRWESWGELLGPLRLLISLQFRLALSALRRDAKRLFQGVTAYLTGLFFLLVFGLLANVLLVLGLFQLRKLTFFTVF